jgi:hypothetical protein
MSFKIMEYSGAPARFATSLFKGSSLLAQLINIEERTKRMRIRDKIFFILLP